MKLKLFITGLIITGIIFSTGITYAASKRSDVPTSYIYQAVSKYKNKNYTGCIQDMDYIIKKGRPTDIAYYYKALSYAQLGMTQEARESYEAAVNISSNRLLVDYANQAIGCIDDASLCDTSLDDTDITKFIKSNEFMHTDVKNQLENQAVDRAKQEINNGAKPTEDFSRINQAAPTDKEIADAVRTLAKLGINPLAGLNPMAGAYGQNYEMAQLGAMFGNQNNNNNMMNLLPMIGAMQSGDKSKISKDFVQTYMMSQMLPNFNFGNSDK